MLSHYYGVRSVEKFPALFGDLYIGQHPTATRNSYLVLEFDFSGIDTTSQEGFAKSFTSNIRQSIASFVIVHRNMMKWDFNLILEKVDKTDVINGLFDIAFRIAEDMGRQIIVIIDEYDHFANDFIALGTPEGIEIYKKHTSQWNSP